MTDTRKLADRVLEDNRYAADVELLQKLAKELKSIQSKLQKIDKAASSYTSTQAALVLADAKIGGVRLDLQNKAFELEQEGLKE